MINTTHTAPSLSRNAGAPQQGSGKPVIAILRLLLKGALYLAAILLLPGALIGAPLLWWLERRKTNANSPRPATGRDTVVRNCVHCG